MEKVKISKCCKAKAEWKTLATEYYPIPLHYTGWVCSKCNKPCEITEETK